MIAPFENAAFSAVKGEIKGPVRTPYGYHIIRVNNIRPASGKVHTAHIFILVPQGSGESGAMAAKQKADSVFAMLKSGADFADLAKKYSEHRETADKGGELNWFGTGEIIGDLAEPAFALKNIGDITEPVRSPFGWHIIKLLERKAPPSFGEARGYIESRINQELIDKKAAENFTARLKKEYRYRENRNTYTSILSKCDSSVIAGKKQLPVTNDGKFIISFADRKISGAMFAEYVNKSMEREPQQTSEVFLRQKLDRFAALKLYEYENSILETKYSDFRYLVKEFHDGILMFELTSAKVWEKAKTDTAGLKNYWRNEWKGDASTPFDQVKDELIAGYQDYLEKEWISQLKKSYAVKTNSKVLDMLKKESENE
jgi:peptidyl-prolyl cis-trans isomerase SurA